MAKFENGDVVELKSGGPRMTVTYIREGGGITGTWFNPEGELRWCEFPPEALEKSGDGS